MIFFRLVYKFSVILVRSDVFWNLIGFEVYLEGEVRENIKRILSGYGSGVVSICFVGFFEGFSGYFIFSYVIWSRIR